jgi:hypothetical protein
MSSTGSFGTCGGGYVNTLPINYYNSAATEDVYGKICKHEAKGTKYDAMASAQACELSKTDTIMRTMVRI